MKTNIKNIWNIFVNFILFNKMSRMITHFYGNLKRSTKWFIRMWNNYDWDSGYLIVMMLNKMKDMRYQLDVVDSGFVDLRHQPIGSNSDYETVDNLKELDEAIEIGERILKHDYIVYPDEYIKWKENRKNSDDFAEEINNMSNMPQKIRKMLMKCYKDADNAERRDNQTFFNLIRDNNYKWWS